MNPRKIKYVQNNGLAAGRTYTMGLFPVNEM
jgi:hypothetical protein